MTNNEKDLSDKSVSQNREYKFRVFLPKHDVTDTISMSEQIYYCDNFLKVHQATHCNSMDKITRPFYIMQYTGLKDKNGLEIYEGDIITMGGSIKYVIERKTPSFLGRDIGTKGSYIGTGYGNRSKDAMILGNIYQNPELLSDI